MVLKKDYNEVLEIIHIEYTYYSILKIHCQMLISLLLPSTDYRELPHYSCLGNPDFEKELFILRVGSLHLW